LLATFQHEIKLSYSDLVSTDFTYEHTGTAYELVPLQRFYREAAGEICTVAMPVCLSVTSRNSTKTAKRNLLGTVVFP